MCLRACTPTAATLSEKELSGLRVMDDDAVHFPFASRYHSPVGPEKTVAPPLSPSPASRVPVSPGRGIRDSSSPPTRRTPVPQRSGDLHLGPASRPHPPWGRFDPYESPEDQDKELVGFAGLPSQVHRKAVKKGFTFTLMVAGQPPHATATAATRGRIRNDASESAGESGLGKSTLIDSLFLTDLYKDRKIPDAEGRRIVSIRCGRAACSFEYRLSKVVLRGFLFSDSRADRSDGQHAQADGQHRGERRQVAAEHRRHAGLRRRRRQHAKVSALRRPARLHAFIFPHPVFPSARQLEASGGLRGAAVRTVLQGRERLGPQEHPGQPRTLLPLLHLSLWTRTATTGRRVLAGLARQSQHRSRAGQSRQPDAGRGAPEEEQGGALTLMLAWSRAPSMTASTRVFRRRSARSSDASGSTSTSSPAATLTTTTTSRGGTGCSRTASRSRSSGATSWRRVEGGGSRVARTPGGWRKLACQISRRRCRRHPAAAGRLRRGQGSIHLGGRPGVTGSHNRRMNGPPVAGLDEPGLCTSTAKRSFRSPRSHLRIGGSRNRQHDDARCGLSPPGGSDVQAAATPRIPLHPLSRSLLFPFLTLTAAVSTALYWSSIIHRLCIVRKIQ
ncbi:uncharacterized protein LOC133491427 isoform X7 [Syngnathoides biaculeatus]|uniref:uncharacterized protein LOC133491427 isoform X7 n=1 Tax=Syngnathoides biaculeatus TaxID=300417 RepID=UPI002ADE1981|nr:uncharacterized protein LOC133491427 isoform X7 [Syngnathoides biaculeatus]